MNMAAASRASFWGVSSIFLCLFLLCRPRWAERVRDLFGFVREEKSCFGWWCPACSIHLLCWLGVHFCHLRIFVWSVTTAEKKKRKKKRCQCELVSGWRLPVSVCLWHRANEQHSVRMWSNWLATHITLSNTHTHICRQRGKHTRSTSSSQEIQWWLFFILMNFWTCSFPLRWWKMETEGVACQINWCVRRERGQNGVIKRKALPPSHAHTHRQQEKTERGGIWFLNLTFTEVISGAFTILHSTVQSCSASTGGFVLKNSVSALFFSLARLINWQKKYK